MAPYIDNHLREIHCIQTLENVKTIKWLFRKQQWWKLRRKLEKLKVLIGKQQYWLGSWMVRGLQCKFWSWTLKTPFPLEKNAKLTREAWAMHLLKNAPECMLTKKCRKFMAGRGLNSWACYWADLQLFIFVFGPNFLDQPMEVLHEYFDS